MKNIVILTKTLTRYGHINYSLSELSKGSLKTLNTFFLVKTLSKFKRNNFFQIFFQDIDLLIIDHQIVVGKDVIGKNIVLLEKIFSLNVINKNTKVLVLVNSGLEKDLKPFETFVFTENAKGEELMESLFEKVKEILTK